MKKFSRSKYYQCEWNEIMSKISVKLSIMLKHYPSPCVCVYRQERPPKNTGYTIGKIMDSALTLKRQLFESQRTQLALAMGHMDIYFKR